MRSKLFVPASRIELLPKAMASAADAVSIDLEDAVLESQKDEARAALSAWLGQVDRMATTKIVIVRVNAMDTIHFERDIEQVVQPGLDLVNLPKPANPQAVRDAVAMISRAEHRNGVVKPIQLLLNIETPAALSGAAALAAADARVMGLQVGLGDLFEPLGMDRRELSAVQQVLFAVRMAAAQAGVMAFDGAFANVADAAGFLAEAQLAKRMGFAGKSCIHPSQIALANEAFRPSDAEILHALNVLNAVDASVLKGHAAFMVDGRMIDPPFLRRAQSIVDLARRLNRLPVGAPSPSLSAGPAPR
jgi:citrate lyase beta subunit